MLGSNRKDINAGQHHGQAIRQSLDNIICIIHNGSDEHSGQSLLLISRPQAHIQHNRNPCPLIVAHKESLGSDSRQIRRGCIHTAEEARRQAELNALDPNVVFLLSLQHHFEENARETARQRADHDAEEAQKRVLLGGAHFRGGGFAAQFHQSNTRHDDDQSDPLAESKLLAEKENREQSGCENLHLVGNRVNCRIEMGDGYEEEIVLHRV